MADTTFSNNNINRSILKERAYNLRWATVAEDVIPLTAADPDFPVAKVITDAIKSYTDAGVFSYGPATGLPAFRTAAANVLQTRKGIKSDPNLILATDGAASGMYTIAKAFLEPGDEVLIFDPVDFLFQKSVNAAGGKVVRIPLDSKTGCFDREQLRLSITGKTKMICVCNPHNPLGRVLSREELLFIGTTAVLHDLWIMNDEIWSDIIFTPDRHTNIASLNSEIANRTVSVYGFSKTFGLAGLRVGFLAAPNKKVFKKILRASEANSTAGGVSTLSQIAAIAAYEHAWPWVDEFLNHLTEVRDYSVDRLNQMPGISCKKPEGTYLLFPNIESFGLSSEEMANYLLENAKVAVVPGAAKWFGPGAEGHIRICFSTSMEIMKEALDRIEMALKNLEKSEIKIETEPQLKFEKTEDLQFAEIK